MGICSCLTKSLDSYLLNDALDMASEHLLGPYRVDHVRRQARRRDFARLPQLHSSRKTALARYRALTGRRCDVLGSHEII